MPDLHSVETGEGFPLLILHGGKVDHRHLLDALEPVFAGTTGWRRIYPDLPGHGQSPSGEGLNTQTDALTRVAAFADAIGGPYAVIGESRGSYLARGLSAIRPDAVRGLCLIVTGGFDPALADTLPPTTTLVPAPQAAENLGPLARKIFGWQVVQSADIAERIERTKIPAIEIHDADAEARIARAFTFNFDPEAHPFPGPALIVNGRQDWMAGHAEALAILPAYPRASFALLDTAGHSLAWERPEIFQVLMRDWLDRLRYALDTGASGTV